MGSGRSVGAAMNQTVFITNRSPTHVYDSAYTFGSIRYVTSGNYPIFKTARLQEEIIDVLAYSTKHDYLLFSGSGVVAALCLTVWLEMHGECRALLWDRTEDAYVLRVIERSNIRLEIERASDRAQGSSSRMVL